MVAKYQITPIDPVLAYIARTSKSKGDIVRGRRPKDHPPLGNVEISQEEQDQVPKY